MASILLGLTTAQIAALTTTQIQGLATSDLDALTTSQTIALTTDSIVALKTSQIGSLTTLAISALLTTQVQAIETSDIAALKSTQVAALTTTQVAAMETQDVAALKTNQIQTLSTDQIVALTTAQVQAFTTAQVAALMTSQVAAMQTQDLAALKTAQVVALTTSGINALSTAQIQSLQTSQLVALTTRQIVAISTDDIAALTTTQVSAFTTRQVESLTNSQVAALGTTNVQYLTAGTPIVLDLNGNGISTQSIVNGVQFDIFGVGQNVNTGWVAGGDGLLVLDRNHDGAVSGGAELFGVGTTLANGDRAGNGYLALAEMDTSGDGIISAADANFADLMVWVDGDSNGISVSTELHSLSSLGITHLDLHAQGSTQEDNGNMVGLVSNYTTSDGAVHEMADVWFATSKTAPDAAIQAPPPALNLLIPGADTTAVAPAAVAAPASSSTLTTQVGSLVDAMAAFDGAGGAATSLTNAESFTGEPTPALVAAAPPLSGGITGMVDALKQFDANGQALVGGKLSTSAALTALTDKPRKPDVDILASGK